MCKTVEYKVLLPTWYGISTLEVLVPAVNIQPTSHLLGWHHKCPFRIRHSICIPPVEWESPLHSLFLWYLPGLGVVELEFALLNISVSLEIYANTTADAIQRLQAEVCVSQIAIQNRMALDFLLASQGVCVCVPSSMLVDVAMLINRARFWQMYRLF